MRSHRSLTLHRSPDDKRGSPLFFFQILYDFILLMGILSVLASLHTLYMGNDFDRKVRLALSRPKAKSGPRVCLTMPCKGDEQVLAANIEAILKQNYNNYQVLIVTDTYEEEAHRIAKSVLARYPSLNAQICTSDRHGKASGKVSALLTAIERTWGNVDVYAFVDSDALVHSDWLAELISPLVDESVGSATGFRWHFPIGNDLWSHVEAAWNASGTNLMFDEHYNFPWGGAMAVRAETFEKIGIRHVWANAVSDDMTLNLALRKQGLRTVFLPQCTVATFNKTNKKQFLEWAIRQTTLTRIFNRRLWNYALAAYVFFDAVSMLGIAGVLFGVLLGPAWFVPSLLLLVPAFLGVPRSLRRCASFKRALPDFESEFRRTCLRNAMASFIVPWIMMYCIIKSVKVREIIWRGRKYQLT